MELTEKDLLRINVTRGILPHTRYFFKQMYGRKFTVNRHHEIIAEALDRVIRGECTRLIINIAPRYSKTELAVKNFMAHGLSLNPAAKFVHLSYSDDLATDNSEAVRDMVQSEEYQALFPYVKIKSGSKGKKKWHTVAGGGVYATSTGGQVTGFGAGLVDEEVFFDEAFEGLDEAQPQEGDPWKFSGALIIDDPIKPEDAESDLQRNKINDRFNSTIRNRVNSRNTPIVIIMQRLHPKDLSGFLMDSDSDDWEVLSLPAIYKNEAGVDRPLWPFKHTLEELMAIRGTTRSSIADFERQYLQNPKPREGLLYSEFKTYLPQDLPNGQVIYNYTDTADTGKDYLCSISYIRFAGLFYVVDVYYSQEPNEVTEGELARRLYSVGVNHCLIESNNGGRAFARNIERISRSIGNRKTSVKWFHQSKNKEVRIKTNSSTVNNCLVFPSNWAVRWPTFYDQVTNYMAGGKNEFDDAQDTMTGIVEKTENASRGVSYS